MFILDWNEPVLLSVFVPPNKSKQNQSYLSTNNNYSFWMNQRFWTDSLLFQDEMN